LRRLLRSRVLALRDLRRPGDPSVYVSADKLKQPARFGTFHIEVVTPEIEPCREEGILRAVKSCLIHNTLLYAPAIEVMVNISARMRR
jgi:hypothetical protein